MRPQRLEPKITVGRRHQVPLRALAVAADPEHGRFLSRPGRPRGLPAARRRGLRHRIPGTRRRRPRSPGGNSCSGGRLRPPPPHRPTTRPRPPRRAGPRPASLPLAFRPRRRAPRRGGPSREARRLRRHRPRLLGHPPRPRHRQSPRPPHRHRRRLARHRPRPLQSPALLRLLMAFLGTRCSPRGAFFHAAVPLSEAVLFFWNHNNLRRGREGDTLR
mmetsp:Transcript_20417/g.63131  ORF Transcript_20417/g.63131 Transcript_20417/m.63131 type:complete len:217 (+) Transcript_20417:744-1394(+)